MNKKVIQVEKIVALFGAALASHYLADQSSSWEEIAKTLGLSSSVVEETFTLGSHILVHSVFENIVEAEKYFENTSNDELKKVILDCYLKTITLIEKDLIEQFKLEESSMNKFARLVLKKDNKKNSDLEFLKENFLEPLRYALTNAQSLNDILHQNQLLSADEFLKKIIMDVIPNYKSGLLDQFIEDVCIGFKKHFRYSFLKQLKQDEKAKTIYFIYLLESLIVSSKDSSKNLQLINDLASQTNLKVSEVLERLKSRDASFSDLLTNTQKFQNDIQEQLKSINLKVQDFSSPVLDKRNRRDYINDYNKFDFKYGYLNFVGRNEELSSLWSFLEQKNSKNRFSWWMITGPGGMGKSRIAQQLCIMANGYYSGFFDFKNDISLNPKWELWDPEMPTLIVIDYALSKIDKVLDLITILSRRSSTYTFPVRLLLIDRKETEEWRKKIRPGNEIEDCIYREPGVIDATKLELKPLEEDFRWKIVQQVLLVENKDRLLNVESNKTELLKKLHDLDNEHRPLFTFFVAIALAKEENIRNWNTHKLLENTLIRFEDLWWKYIEEKEVRKEIRFILLVNTLCGQLNNKELDKLLSDLEINISYGDLKDSYMIVADYRIVNENDLWNGLQPDILGEFFIIKALTDILKEQPNKGIEIIKNIFNISCNLNVEGVINMAYLIWSDFYNEEIFQKLDFDILDYLYNTICLSNNELAKNELANIFTNICAKKCELKLFDQAIKDGDRAISLNKLNDGAYNNRGQAKIEIYLFDDGMDDFNKAIEINPQLPAAYYNKGRVKLESKLYEESIELFNMAIRLEPNGPLAYNDRALANFYLNNYEAGIIDIEVALAINPTMAVFYNNRGLIKVGFELYESAILDYEKAIEIDNEYALGYFNRAVAYYHLKEFSKALAGFNDSITLNNTDGDYYAWRANTHLMLGSRELGCQDYKRAIDLGHKQSKIMYNTYCIEPKIEEKRRHRNDFVNVLYKDGTKKYNIKFKKVELDIQANKCKIFED